MHRPAVFICKQESRSSRTFETHGHHIVGSTESPRRYASLVPFVARCCHRALAVDCADADARSSSTWSGSGPGASTVESIPCRAELEFSCQACEAHGLFRPCEVHPVWRKPTDVPLAGIRIPYRIRVLRQLDVWRRSSRPQWLRHEPGDAPFRFPCGQSLPPLFRVRV